MYFCMKNIQIPKILVKKHKKLFCIFERRQIRNLNETFGRAKMPTVHKFHSKLNNNYKYLFIWNLDFHVKPF